MIINVLSYSSLVYFNGVADLISVPCHIDDWKEDTKKLEPMLYRLLLLCITVWAYVVCHI